MVQFPYRETDGWSRQYKYIFKIYFTSGQLHGTIFPIMVISFVSKSTSKKIKKNEKKK